jgi:vacuolar protein sorting-associated protein 18
VSILKLETGYFSNAPYGIDTTTDPLFVLGRVQVDIPGSLVAFTVASDQLFMATTDLLIHINLRSPEKIIKIPLSTFLNPKQNTGRQQNTKQPSGPSNGVYKLHLDPSGKHLIIATTSPDTNLYVYTKWPTLTPRPIKSFKMVIESVAWNRSFLLSHSSEHSTGTREILIGGRGGVMYEAVLDSKEDFFKGHDRSINAIFTLPERQPIAGLVFQWFGGERGNVGGRGLVVATTATRIYQFVGGAPEKREDGRIFSGLFAGYKGAELSEYEVSLSKVELTTLLNLFDRIP